MHRVICSWSGPRNLSTALMRSFGARADTTVWDEPFFAPYLLATGTAHPGRAETLAAHETDARAVARACTAAAMTETGERLFFQKHMAHHMLAEFPLAWAAGAQHLFLLREPARVVASYARGRREFCVEDLGFAACRRLHARLAQLTGRVPPVVHSRDILAEPEATLRRVCAALDIAWDPAMLSWRAGRRTTDGAWAPWWYGAVEASTGFGPPPGKLPDLDADLTEAARACRTDYDALAALAL